MTILFDHTAEQARTYSEAAFKRIKHDNMPHIPPLYEVWYVYYARLHGELVAAVDALGKDGRTPALEEYLTLHEQYLKANKSEEAVRRASSQIQETITDISAMVNSVQKVTNNYRKNLSDAGNQITAAQSKEDIQKIVANVSADTAKIMSYNHKLEEQLQQSAGLVQTLMTDLNAARKEALTDGLTGIPNRKAFDQKIKELAQGARETAEPLTMLMIDIDHFKKFNDTYGHQVGDQVLRLVAKTLTDGIKGKDFAARYGGEEFSILLPETEIEGGVAVGNALRRALAAKEIVNKNSGEKMGKITMSIGVSQFDMGEKIDTFIKRADEALYTAKQNGRNQVASSRMK